MEVSLLNIGIIGFFAMLVLMFLKMPIGISFAAIGFIGYAYVSGFGQALSMLRVAAHNTASMYTLTVIPLFVLMGTLAANAGLSKDLFYATNKWLGHLPGGLAMATVGGCTGFAAVCGDSIATALTMCSVSLPEMRRYNYDDRLSLGTIASGGQLGFMIPPSIPFVIYSFLTEESIGTLFIAGILPGLVIAALFIIAIYVVCRCNPKMGPVGPRASWGERFRSLYAVWGVLALFLLVLGGIYGGIFTPTEAGAVGAFGALLLGVVRRQMGWQGFFNSLADAAWITGMILILIIGSVAFNFFLNVTELPFTVAQIVAGLPVPPIVIMSAMLVVYVIVGFFMSVIGAMMITVPIILPVLLVLGIDPIWFGVLCVLTVMLGNVTPPVGNTVFAVGGMVRDVPMYTIFAGVWPFVYAMLAALVILVAFPQISLFLPHLMRPVWTLCSREIYLESIIY